MPKGNTKFTAVDPAMAGRSVKALLRDSKNNLSQRVKTRLNSTDRSPRGDLMLDPPKEDLHGSNSKWLGYERNVLPGTTIRLT